MTTVASISAAAVAGCAEEGTTDSASGSNDNANDDAASGSNDDAADESTATDATETEADAPDVTILDHELVEGPMGEYAEVAGTVQNTSGEEQSYIGVEAKFFDADDTRIGETMWNAEDVAADRKVEFETVMSTTSMDDVETYEIEASTSAF